MRKIKFVNNEYYHIFNRGVDKRVIYIKQNDIKRFLQSMNEFNIINPIGSIYENQFENRLGSRTPKSKKLVEIICYCLLPNHYHFVLKQLVDNGIVKFMHKIGTGYTNHFNEKYKRSGSLFQGAFKAVHINSNEQLLHNSVYVNLNNKVHQLGSRTPKLQVKSSWNEYMSNKKDTENNFCTKDIILDQFNTLADYREFAEESLKEILERREDMKMLILEE